MRPVGWYDLQRILPQGSFCLRVSRELATRRLPLRRFAHLRNLSPCDKFIVAGLWVARNDLDVISADKGDAFRLYAAART